MISGRDQRLAAFAGALPPLAGDRRLPYENPKLSAMAVAQMDGKSFAAALERALMRSRSSVPALAAPQVEHPAEELKGNFPMRRRNLR